MPPVVAFVLFASGSPHTPTAITPCQSSRVPSATLAGKEETNVEFGPEKCRPATDRGADRPGRDDGGRARFCPRPRAGGDAGRDARPAGTGGGYNRYREMTLEEMLLENRVVFLVGEINHVSASRVIMQMLYLQSVKRIRTSTCTSIRRAASSTTRWRSMTS